MKVRLLVPRTGPAGSQGVGDEVDVSKDEAQRMFDAVPPQAVPVSGADDETADKLPAFETRRGKAAKPKG